MATCCVAATLETVLEYLSFQIILDTTQGIPSKRLSLDSLIIRCLCVQQRLLVDMWISLWPSRCCCLWLCSWPLWFCCSTVLPAAKSKISTLRWVKSSLASFCLWSLYIVLEQFLFQQFKSISWVSLIFISNVICGLSGVWWPLWGWGWFHAPSGGHPLYAVARGGLHPRCSPCAPPWTPSPPTAPLNRSEACTFPHSTSANAPHYKDTLFYIKREKMLWLLWFMYGVGVSG